MTKTPVPQKGKRIKLCVSKKPKAKKNVAPKRPEDRAEPVNRPAEPVGESQMNTQQAQVRYGSAVVNARCSPNRILELHKKLVELGLSERVKGLDSIGFGGTLKVKMNQLPFEFRRWVVDVYDVESRTFIIGDDMRMKISGEDVHEVYGLPKGKREVDLSETMEKEMNDMVAELGLKFEKANSTNIDLKLLRDRLYEIEVDKQTWCQMYVLFVMGSLLCPKTRPVVSMDYARLIQKNRLRKLLEYNWCSYVAEQLHEGMVKSKKGKYIEGDLHLVMVSICQKFGSRPSRPTPTLPFCDYWDTQKVKTDLKAVRRKSGYQANEGSETDGKPVFVPTTNLTFTGMSTAKMSDMEQWITSIRDNCNVHLTRLREARRQNIAEGKRQQQKDTPSDVDDSSEKTESIGLNDVPTNAEEEVISVSKGKGAGGSSKSEAKSGRKNADKGPSVSEIAAETVRGLDVDDDDDFENIPLQELLKRKRGTENIEKGGVRERPKRSRKPAPSTVSPYTTEGKMKNRTENVKKAAKTVRVTQVDENEMLENIDVEVEALKEYILHAKDEWKNTIIDFGSAEFCVQAAQMAEFLSMEPVCSHIVDSYGYALNWLAAEHGNIKK